MSENALQLVIIDDEQRVTKALEREIRIKYPSIDFSIHTFQNPLEGLEFVQNNQQTVFMVISDLRMPGMNGAELLERIRSFDKDIQTTLLTAYSDMDDIRRAVSANIRSLLPKPWDQDRLFSEVESALAEFKLRKENTKLRLELEKQLQTASDFQKAMLSLHEKAPAYPFIAVEYYPQKHIGCGGDYYDAFTLKDGRVIVLTGDVAGHGIKPALVTVMIKTIIQSKRILGDFIFTTPKEFLSKLNNELLLLLSSSPDTIVAFSAIFIDPQHQQIQITNAGLPPVLISYSTGSFEYFFQDGPALGFSAEAQYNEHALTMQKGDTITIMTDGLTENRTISSSNQESYEQLAQLISAGTPAHTIVEFLRNKQQKKEFNDDATLMLIQF